VPRAAATQVLLAASPQVGGITGEFWSDCQIAKGSPLLGSTELAKRLWDVSEGILALHGTPAAKSLREAA
jgi:WW domain-containing oxidoreductase